MIPDVIDFSNDVSMVMLKPTTPTDKEFECKNLSSLNTIELAHLMT